MFYVDKNNIDFDLTLTLGDVDTNNPPPLALGYNRKGTNETGVYIVPAGDVTTGDRYITIAAIPTTTFAGTGQYNFNVYDYTVPSTPVLIEKGIFIVLTDDPITKTEYGTDKIRGEYKGHI